MSGFSRLKVVPAAEFLKDCVSRWLASVRIGLAEGEPLGLDFREAVRIFESRLMSSVLAECEGPGKYITASARLGMHRNSLRVKLRELGLYPNRGSKLGRPAQNAEAVHAG